MRLRTQVDFDIDFDSAQGFAVGQLRKRHGKELIQTGEVFDLVISLMRGHAAGKGSQRQMLHELREYELALVHGGLERKSAQNPKSGLRRSNRNQTEKVNSPSNSLTYGGLV